MAVKAIEGTKSLRLNTIPAGASVSLHDFQTGKPFATGTLSAWRNGKGENIPAPSVMKAMPADTTLDFIVNTENAETGETDSAVLTLVKDPAGYGCMFRNVQTDETKEPILRRVTAYAASDVFAERDAKRKKEAEEKAKAKALAEIAANEAEKENNKPKGKQGRKAKGEATNTESAPVVEETTEATA